MFNNSLFAKIYARIVLKKYHVHLTEKRPSTSCHTISKWLSEPTLFEEKIHIVLNDTTHSNKTVYGLSLAKQYSVLLMAVYDYLLLRHEWIDCSPENVHLHINDEGHIAFYIKPTCVTDIHDLDDQEVFNMIHDQLLEKHISPFMDLISVKLRTKKTHLLSLMSHNLLQRARYLEKKFTFTHNHQALLQGFTQSPPTYIEFDFQTVQVDDQEILIRKHCCLKYLEQDGDLKNSCKTCPKRYKDL